MPLGSNVAFDVSVSSDGKDDGVQVVFPIEGPTTTRRDEPLFCGDSNYAWGSVSFCREFHDVQTFRFGVVAAGIWPIER